MDERAAHWYPLPVSFRRAGELLKQIEPGQGARDGKRGEGVHTPLTREEAARDAGMSKHQQVLEKTQ